MKDSTVLNVNKNPDSLDVFLIISERSKINQGKKKVSFSLWGLKVFQIKYICVTEKEAIIQKKNYFLGVPCILFL